MAYKQNEFWEIVVPVDVKGELWGDEERKLREGAVYISPDQWYILSGGRDAPEKGTYFENNGIYVFNPGDVEGVYVFLPNVVDARKDEDIPMGLDAYVGELEGILKKNYIKKAGYVPRPETLEKFLREQGLDEGIVYVPPIVEIYKKRQNALNYIEGNVNAGIMNLEKLAQREERISELVKAGVLIPLPGSYQRIPAHTLLNAHKATIGRNGIVFTDAAGVAYLAALGDEKIIREVAIRVEEIGEIGKPSYLIHPREIEEEKQKIAEAVIEERMREGNYRLSTM